MDSLDVSSHSTPLYSLNDIVCSFYLLLSLFVSVVFPIILLPCKLICASFDSSVEYLVIHSCSVRAGWIVNSQIIWTPQGSGINLLQLWLWRAHVLLPYTWRATAKFPVVTLMPIMHVILSSVIASARPHHLQSLLHQLIILHITSQMLRILHNAAVDR